jgi:hypothetical protein
MSVNRFNPEKLTRAAAGWAVPAGTAPWTPVLVVPPDPTGTSDLTVRWSSIAMLRQAQVLQFKIPFEEWNGTEARVRRELLDELLTPMPTTSPDAR